MVSSYAMTACVSYTPAAQKHFGNEVKVGTTTKIGFSNFGMRKCD